MTKKKARHIYRTRGLVSLDDRRRLLGQKGCVVWLTGLSGSGKSTIARALERELAARRHLAYVLDGDNIRGGLNEDLGFSPEDRGENIRRVAHVAALFADAGVITVTAFISPYRAGRKMARSLIGASRFVEVFLNAPLVVCETRDPKGLYRKARRGGLGEFTGVSAPYEPPRAPAITLDTASLDADTCVRRIVRHLTGKRLLSPPP